MSQLKQHKHRKKRWKKKKMSLMTMHTANKSTTQSCIVALQQTIAKIHLLLTHVIMCHNNLSHSHPSLHRWCNKYPKNLCVRRRKRVNTRCVADNIQNSICLPTNIKTRYGVTWIRHSFSGSTLLYRNGLDTAFGQ